MSANLWDVTVFRNRLFYKASETIVPFQHNYSMEVSWSLEEVNDFIECCHNTLNYKALKDLELRARTGTGTEHLFHLGPSCCDGIPQDISPSKTHNASCEEHNGHERSCLKKKYNASKYKFKKKEDDDVGELLDSLVDSSGLKYIIKEVAEKSWAVLTNVLEKNKADIEYEGIDVDMIRLREEILREALIRTVLSRANKIRLETHSTDSKEGGFIASPIGFRGPLDSLENMTLSSLATHGFAIQDNFMGDTIRSSILQDVELIEFDGGLREMKNGSFSRVTHRQDRMCWLRQSQIDRELHKGLFALMEKLTCLPFELNKKVGLYCQVSSLFQLAVFPATGAFYKKHFDSGFSQSTNTGRKITVIYYPNELDWKEENGGYLCLYKKVSRQEQLDKESLKSSQTTTTQQNDVPPSENNDTTLISPKGDRLVIFQSRIIPHEVLPTFRKRFAITLWISGPTGPGDEM